jgi:ankyrin repeat protein
MGDIFQAIKGKNDYWIDAYARRGEINSLNARGFSPLGYAVRIRFPPHVYLYERIEKETLNRLINWGANPNYMEPDGLTPFLAFLIDRSGAEYIASLKLFLHEKDWNEGADLAIPVGIPNRYVGFTALHIAAWNNWGDVLDLLIKNGANVNALVVSDNEFRGFTPLLLAAEGGYEKQVRRLLEARADPSIFRPNNTSALSLAAKSGNFECVKLLFNKLNIVNVPNDEGKTPLIYACFSNKLDIVRFFIEKGAEVNHQAVDGTTALMAAANLTNLGMIEELLRAGANVNLRRGNGGTALLYAISPTSNLRVITPLLEAGADVNAADRDGNTPLLTAVQLGKNDIILELLRRGADSTRTFRGQTIAAYARTQGLPAEILEALTFSRRHHALRGFATAATAASRRGGRRTRRRSTRRQR